MANAAGIFLSARGGISDIAGFTGSNTWAWKKRRDDQLQNDRLAHTLGGIAFQAVVWGLTSRAMGFDFTGYGV
jgi:hypothetical protein